MQAPAALRDQARFVFKGTVQKLRAATMSQLTDRQDLAIVRVDQIIRAPDVFTDFVGRDITVKLLAGKPLKQNAQAVFYTNAWIMADSLAVEATAYETSDQAPARAAMMPSGSPVDNLRLMELKSRVDTADVVISGRVTAVRTLAGEQPRRTAAVAANESPAATKISEHDPMWRDAEIEVEAVHKGNQPARKVVVRFPASTDVRWHKAKKFEAGQEGYFILHKSGQAAAARQAR
jgi:hypothetical protein